MAMLALPLIGAGIGGAIGGTFLGVGAAAWGMAIGNLAAVGLNSKVRTSVSSSEASVQTIVEGAPRPIVYGTAPCYGNVIDEGRVRRVETTQKSGGKGAPKVTQTTVQLFATYAVRICAGPIGGILAAWRDGICMYDVREGNNMGAANTKFLANTTFYLGDEEQLPDPSLEAIAGVGNVVAHRGTAYAVHKDDDITQRGSLPQWKYLVTSTPVSAAPDAVFVYTGADQLYVVPEGVTSVYVKAWGAGGSAGRFRDSELNVLVEGKGGGGGFVAGVLNVTPGETLKVIVGGGGRQPPDNSPPRYAPPGGGWGGGDGNVMRGGNGGARNGGSAGGAGGAGSSVFRDSAPLLVAPGGGGGGGGNGGAGFNINGAPGGGLVAEHLGKAGVDDGRVYGGGGTQDAAGIGGHGGASGQNGQTAVGHAGGHAAAGTPPAFLQCGGGGGGGYRGGGAGGAGPVAGAGGGGGGSALVPPGGSSEAGDDHLPGGMSDVDYGGFGLGATGEGPGGHGAVMFFLNYAFEPGVARLGDVIADVHARCNAVQPDVSDVQETRLPGLLLGSADYTGADVIETLRPVYLFDRLECDGAIRYIRRGKDAVATLTIDDLVNETEEAPRDDAKQIPRKVHLFYRSANSNYEEVPATSVDPSPDREVVGEASFRVPVVMDDEDAHQLARILHKVAFAEADGEVTIATRMSQLKLVPGHTINLDVRGKVRRLRINQIDDVKWRRRLICRMDRKTAVLVNPIFQPLPPLPPSESRDPGDTTLAVLDIGALREQDDTLGYYVAVTGDQTAWNTAVVQRSVDAGESFVDLVALGAAVVGRLVDAVPEASEHYTDTTNVVRVQLLRVAQEIEPVSDAAFLSGGGAFALQNTDGGWEVLQYRDAEDEGDGVFALSVLHRGLLNSGSSEHDAQALFVLLSGVTKVSAQSTWLDKDLVHRAPTVGQSPEEADQVTTTFYGRMQTEWPVASFNLARDGETVSGTWAWRHRFGSDARPLASVNFQGARVTLTDGSNSLAFDTAEPGFERELVGWASPVTVTVAAINRITGLGPTVTGDI